jgi:hypothetical protein
MIAQASSSGMRGPQNIGAIFAFARSQLARVYLSSMTFEGS